MRRILEDNVIFRGKEGGDQLSQTEYKGGEGDC